VTKDIDITNVLTEPRRIRNCFLVISIMFEPMIAAWEEPSPGKKEAKGDTRVVRIVGFIISFFVRMRWPIFCFGIFIFCEIE